VHVEDARHADAPTPALRDRVLAAALERARVRRALHLAPEGARDLDVLFLRPRLGQRRELLLPRERLERLVGHEVRELLHDRLALFDEREHRLVALDRALLAGEAADVARGRSVRAERVDEGAA